MTAADALRSPDVEVRLAAIAELTARGRAEPEELAALAECLGDERKAVQRRAAEAFAALARHGAAGQGLLLTTLHSLAPRQRWGAAFALSLLGPPPAESLSVLLEALGASDGDMRWAAAEIVCRLPERETVAASLQRLVTRGTPLERKMALYCLRDLAAPSPDLEGVIATALGDGDAGVRLAAMSALASLAADGAAAARRLLPLLEDADEGVRRAAAAALGRLGERSEAVIAALREAAGSADASLRRSAERALRLLGATT
jgi:HEAT repeat protein